MYGATFINDSNLIQIDDVYKNYQIYSSGSISTFTTTLTAPIGNYLLLVKPQTYDSNVYYTGYKYENSTTIYFNVQSVQVPIGVINKVVDYILLKEASSLTVQGNYGLNVYDSLGKLCYTSTLKTPTLSQAFQIPASSYINTSATLTTTVNKFNYLEITAARYIYMDGQAIGADGWEQQEIDRGVSFTSDSAITIRDVYLHTYSSSAGFTNLGCSYTIPSGLASQPGNITQPRTISFFKF